MQLLRTGGTRDLRVDFFRGVALWWIFTDHIAGNVLADYSLHDVAVCDAAEIFVLLAGFAGAKAYAGAMDRHGWAYGAADAIKRAWTLYIAHIFLFVLYAAQVSWAARVLSRPDYLAEARLDVLAQHPLPALLQALALRYQPSMLNILPLYVALLTLFALAMPLLRRPRILLAGSVGLYLLTLWGRGNLPGWGGTGWYFDPFSWQLVFVIGAVAGYAPITCPRRPRVIDAVAILVLGIGAVLVLLVQPGNAAHHWLSEPVLDALLGTDKTHEPPTRLASMLALLWLAARLVPVRAGWLRSRAARAITLLGQHSLPVFAAGIVLAFLCQLALEAEHGVAMQIAINGGGAAAMLGVATVAAWFGTPGRTQRPLRTMSPAPMGTLAVAPVDPAAAPAGERQPFRMWAVGKALLQPVGHH